MMKKNLLAFAVFLAIFQILSAGEIFGQANNSRIFSERFVVQAVRKIHSAEATYQATTGNGLYGSLEQLRAANLIDTALADGEKYGYVFALTVTHPTATTPAKFKLTATPRVYPKAGRYSFYVDQEGDIRGADKRGAVATSNDPIIDDCSLYADLAQNERCTIRAMRTFFSAQVTYFNTVGNGSYGSIADLQYAGLIRPSLGSGQSHGYYFLGNRGFNGQLFFYFQAVPQNYGVTGHRSFYVGTDGIIHGADHQGGNADENDPPVIEN